MRFYEYIDIINGEGTKYLLRVKNKEEALRKLETICPFGWDLNYLIKIKWYEVTIKDFLKLFIKGILREDIRIVN